MTHVTCRLTAKNRDELRNPTLSNWVGLWATFTFFTIIDWKFEFDDFLNFVEFTNFLRILKMLMSFKNKIRYRENHSQDGNIWRKRVNTIGYRRKQHCNVRRANIGLLA